MDEEERQVDEPVSAAPTIRVAPEFPEGGLRAWLVVVGSSCCFFAAFGQVNSFGAYEDFYVRHYLTDYTAADISWIGSVQLCLQSCIGMIAGALFDRGYFHQTVAFGSVLYVVCMFMLSLAKPGQYYQVFLSQGLGVGLGLGLIFIPSMSVISHYFARRRAFAMGLAFAGSSLGGIIQPIMVNKLLNSKLGFANGVRANTGLIAGMLLIGNLLMRPRPAREIHLAPRAPMDVKKYVRDGPYMMLLLSSFFITLGMFIPMVYLQLDAVQHGIDPNLAFYLLAILNGASFFGRIVPNFLADKFGALRVQITTGAICACIALGMLGIRQGDVAGVAVIAALYGFFSGANISLWGPLIAEFSPSLQELGARSGFLYIWVGLAGLLGNPIGGWLLTTHYHWWRLILWSVLTMVVAVGTLIVAEILHARRRLVEQNLSARPSVEENIEKEKDEKKA
ncbi:MFS general substrate transporter [Exidia glandulosa HHB12029]|uniref:MFS general substrate transporter n=1 Tax=Exidia glandulosa HHB12029 TaxID=1314781 RepID=A0A165LE82_EXIGL|nr:MFS general substrate transporter [Exidia glandulosa HHB12029]